MDQTIRGTADEDRGGDSAQRTTTLEPTKVYAGSNSDVQTYAQFPVSQPRRTPGLTRVRKHSNRNESHINSNHIMIFAILGWVLFGISTTCVVCHMMAGNMMTGPPWDPAGTVPFRTWVREVQAWLNVTSSRLQPSQQAAAIQLGLRGVAREFAVTIPAAAINFGANIEGTATDPATYLLYTFGNRYEALEDERTLMSGQLLLGFIPARRTD